MDISSLTATNVHVSNSYIPDDIVFSILSKLSLKSLKRFACVRKSWFLLFGNPTFMTMYRKSFLTKDHSYYEGTTLLLNMAVDEVTEYKYYLYSVSGERFENRFKLNWPTPFLEDQDDPQIKNFGSINGALCLGSFCNGFEKIILWNPTTNEVKVFPSEFFKPRHFRKRVCWTHRLVGYDCVKDDYKVIQFSFCVSDVSFWDLYSLRSNSWRKIDYNIPYFCIHNQQAYMDGVTHWLGKSKERLYLGSFYCSDESIVTTPIPYYVDDCCDWDNVWKHLVILNGSIALVLNNTKTSTFQISILGEVGVEKSWTKLFIVEDLPCLEHFVGAGKKGKILFRRKDGELVWFDLNTRMIDETGVKAIKFNCNILFHRESILPIWRNM